MSSLNIFILLVIFCVCEAMAQYSPHGMHVAGSDTVHNGRVGRPHFGMNGGGSGNNARNYGVGLDGSLGTKVWQSRNGRHSVGVGGTYGRDFGKFQGQPWRSQPRWSAGAGYRFRF